MKRARLTFLTIASAGLLMACTSDQDEAQQELNELGNTAESADEPGQNEDSAQNEPDDDEPTEANEPNGEANNGATEPTNEENDNAETSADNDPASEATIYNPENADEERTAAQAKEENYMDAGTFTGGEITDGKSIGYIDHGIHETYERLVIDIFDGAYGELTGPSATPAYFEATLEAYPARIVYTISGIRGLPEELPTFPREESASQAAYETSRTDDEPSDTMFRNVTSIPLFDDATIMLAAYLNEPALFEVFEVHDSAAIVTDVTSLGETTFAPVHSVRSASVSQEEDLQSLEQISVELMEVDANHVRTLHSADDTFFVEEGYYESAEAAQQRITELNNSGIETEFFVEERAMTDIPQNLR
ncbi:hypothetical protein FLK61_39195 [Paenalkalicoccus suaedae]|uniref:SPOR domain-containing protein n=1 Tax=Paenalkalicoccus suaedae TaxID=2592382 RepID=A0A859FGZ8_9BACI|nr:hypothetical protein [Paenalkalicoccus suaedae]QKS72643.1 hypothetical protein FLK61_39195 [Paenalkalicoccus suaedae]